MGSKSRALSTGLGAGLGAAAAPTAGRVPVPPARRVRRSHLDNLKVVLVSGVILGHAFITYGDIGSWAYRETSNNDVFNIVAAVVVSLGSLFAMGLFFLIAGLLTPGPAQRKGPRAFLRDRALRLGVPFLAYLLLVYPLVNWAGEGEHPVGWYLHEQLTELDPGPLWFVGVLWVFSAAYVGWRAVRPGRVESPPLRASWLLALGGAIGIGSLVVRLGFPIDSQQVFAAHVWQWPQCIGLFILGTLAAERCWLNPVPAGVRRVGGWVALAATVAILAAMSAATSLDAFAGGLTWQAALTAACEGATAVGVSLWLLGTFQRHFDHTGPLSAALGRAAFGAYVLQAPVLVTVSLLARELPLSPEAKFLLVAPTAIATSFALAWLLTRLPGTRDVL